MEAATKVLGIVENGVIRPLSPIDLPDGTQVEITVPAGADNRVRERVEAREKLRVAIDEMRQDAAARGLDKMTMGEIDEEIRKARAERRTRK